MRRLTAGGRRERRQLRLRARPGVAGAMRDEQRAWLTRRHACGGDRGCLSRVYAARIRDLRAAYDGIDKPI